MMLHMPFLYVFGYIALFRESWISYIWVSKIIYMISQLMNLDEILTTVYNDADDNAIW